MNIGSPQKVSKTGGDYVYTFITHKFKYSHLDVHEIPITQEPSQKMDQNTNSYTVKFTDIESKITLTIDDNLPQQWTVKDFIKSTILKLNNVIIENWYDMNNLETSYQIYQLKSFLKENNIEGGINAWEHWHTYKYEEIIQFNPNIPHLEFILERKEM